MRDRECKRCKKCNAELHPEFVVPVSLMGHYYCPKCAKEIKEFMNIKDETNE